MFRKIAISAVSALSLMTGAALAAESEAHVEDVAFSFEGPFGTFDQHQLQRGLQVYTEVCAACHGLKFLRIGALGEPGGPELPEAHVKAYAKALTVVDKDTGEERTATPADLMPANTAAGAPDLSVMAKARAGFHGPMGLGINQLVFGMGGPEHIYSVLVGYEENPACAPEGIDGLYYNAGFAPGAYPDSCKIFEEEKTVVNNEDGTKTEKIEMKEVGRMVPGSWISMPPPLSADQVTYSDGTEQSVENYAEDVSAFLMWAAEPKMMVRKESGFKAVLLMALLSVLLYLTNKKLWSGVKGRKEA